jgi:hypothetical protein
MKNIIRNLIVGTGILVLLTHTVSAQWAQIDSNRFIGSTTMCLAASDSSIFVGSDLPYVNRITDNGTWTVALIGRISAFAVSGSSIFAGGYGVFRTDNGTSWTAVDSGLTNMAVRSFAVSSGNLFAGTDSGVFLSTNNGTSWTAVNSGLTDTRVYSLAVSGSSIFASTTSSVYHSSNSGSTWTAVGSNSGLPASSYYCHLAASGNNVFAGKWGINGIYRSSNNGATWTAVNSGLPESTWVFSFAVSGNNIFAGTNSAGVFLSTNSGTSWTGFYDGLPGWGVDGLAVGESYIFASVTAHAMHQIWRRPLSEIVGTINGKPQQGLVKPYADGFKINIIKNRIAVLLPETMNNGAITVGLFTIAGKRIYSAKHQAYNGILNVPVSGLSTGTYLMSIRGNTATLSSPFFVTK